MSLPKIGRNDLCPCGSNLKYKRCHEGRLFAFEAQRFVISIKKNNKLFPIFDIIFNCNKKGNSSIIVTFPYVPDSKGLLSKVTFPKNNLKIDKLSLEPGGKVTSHKIKYSHWSDGAVHFSQDGKIYSLKKENSDSLLDNIGHIFSVHVKDFESYPIKEKIKDFSIKKIDLDYEVIEDNQDTVKFTAWWYKDSTVHPFRSEFSRTYYFRQSDGTIQRVFAMKPPKTSPLHSGILLLCGKLERLTDEKGSHLIFLGGFDKKDISKDLNNDLNFLALMYPTQNYQELREKLGSVDLPINIQNNPPILS